MRIKNSLNNIIFNLGSTFITYILSFVSRSIFIYTLGAQYLGINGLFSNILMMLSLAELGIGTAINFSLYKPIAQKDNNKISTLMTFYRKAYSLIGCIVAVFGFILMFFLHYIIKDANTIENLRMIYLLYLFSTVSGYFLSYKTTLVSAYQKDYTLVPINVAMSAITILGQIVILMTTKSFIYYLFVQIIFGFIQRIIINNVITKQYKDIDFKTKEKLPQSELNVIIKNVKAMFYHKIGDYCVNGTDNIVISTFVGIKAVGFYSNYTLLITTVNAIIMIIFNSTSASFGDLIAKEKPEKRLEKFRVLNFLGFWFFGFATICFYNLLNPFITLWIGNKYILDLSIIIPVIINYYLVGMRVSLGIVKSSGGVYAQDRFVPLIQAIVNLFFSIILVKYIGLAGVFWGTVISAFVPMIYRPYVVYKYIFETSCKKYLIQYTQYLLVVVVNIFVTSTLCKMLFLNAGWVNLIGRGFICVVIPNLLIVVLFRKSYEFKQLINIVKENKGGFRSGKKG
ncbi:oligosaccharide flippase family protein [Clostridium tagluense]|uniref:lipopolysaccharide biosynthesis protein n=1 Tax=Clostridium tagluense TaxID=360422 RepID=UPI001C0BC269|nr:oligosaccharide flippase family protein [Clostridium tagluense]MBU3126853.1 oligosaccharide flippase family protein [Clostridium tagluense]MCB2310528.1 oligosaccharide flippase family protein [Clostridium tagluense]MCB2315306.1 oligosaccharide flippase family protein [Clostridium tagluense]MCB2320157.1 oligosaccharide flippase family protein [Clostridium tagluense]MCB2325048.1 oligosaccharide flippase family protein [Clostridium tagluense]